MKNKNLTNYARGRIINIIRNKEIKEKENTSDYNIHVRRKTMLVLSERNRMPNTNLFRIVKDGNRKERKRKICKTLGSMPGMYGNNHDKLYK